MDAISTPYQAEEGRHVPIDALASVGMVAVYHQAASSLYVVFEPRHHGVQIDRVDPEQSERRSLTSQLCTAARFTPLAVALQIGYSAHPLAGS